MLKIIQNNKVIDVVKTPSFVNFLPSGHVAFTDKSSAKGVVGSDGQTIYSFVPSAKYAVVTSEEISAEEFESFQKLLSSGQEPDADASVLEKAKAARIRSLSNMCKNKITSGFSVILADGNVHAFKLTVEDQLNLMMLENQLNSGVENFIYHATEEPCRIYKREDVIRIVNAFKTHTLYHTTYFNTAKQYIKSLVDIEKVNLFTYGDDVSSILTDPVLAQILKNGGNV
jgi:hypothetical protein